MGRFANSSLKTSKTKVKNERKKKRK